MRYRTQPLPHFAEILNYRTDDDDVRHGPPHSERIGGAHRSKSVSLLFLLSIAFSEIENIRPLREAAHCEWRRVLNKRSLLGPITIDVWIKINTRPTNRPATVPKNGHRRRDHNTFIAMKFQFSFNGIGIRPSREICRIGTGRCIRRAIADRVDDDRQLCDGQQHDLAALWSMLVLSECNLLGSALNLFFFFVNLRKICWRFEEETRAVESNERVSRFSKFSKE